jgi:transposase
VSRRSRDGGAGLDREAEGAEVVLPPFRFQLDLLMTIPGVSRTTAFILLAEIGVDISQFLSSPHLVSWAGLCRRSDQSAGNRRSTRLREGDTWLKTPPMQSVWAAARK